jgi:hypothetical protein
MNCVEPKCDGEIDLENGTGLQTGCHSSTTAFPCKVCGRLHFLQGDEVHKIPFGVLNGPHDERVFLIDNQIVNKPPLEEEDPTPAE